MKLGKFEINSLDTGIFGLDGGAMFGVIPKVLWAKQYDKGDALNRIPLAASPLIVKTEDRLIMIDTGNGDKYDAKFFENYGLDAEKSSIHNALKLSGYKPEDFTDIILTHLHFDHAGGAVVKIDGELQASFPNAKYYVQKAQYEHSKKPYDKDRASFIADNYEPLLNAGVLELLDGPGELFKGVNLVISNGHTPGMQLVELESECESMVFCADLCPTSAHIGYPYSMGYDNFPITIIEEKKELFPKYFEKGTILYFEHDAFLKGCKLTPAKKGFAVGERFENI